LNEDEIVKLFWKIKDLPEKEVDLLWLENKLEAIKALFAEEGIEWYCNDGEAEFFLQLSLEFLERKKDGEGIFHYCGRRKGFYPYIGCFLKINFRPMVLVLKP
jgi:hypothetical protein